MKIADVSKWQGTINWKKAAKELSFVILRASCGSGMDSKFLENVEGCRKNGIPFGVYHYVMAGNANDACKEASYFVQCVEKASTSPKFYIADIEYKAQNEETTEEVCVAFLETLRAKGCEKIGLYINQRYKWAGKAIGMCDIMWIPHWGSNDGKIPTEDRFKPKYPHDLWQYTSKGRVDGIDGNVDLSVLTGTKPLEYFIGEKTAETREDLEETKMTYDPKEVIAIAEAEVGYLEKKSNADLDDKTANAGDKNYTKYARELDALNFYNGRKNGYAWCDVFVDWCFVKAYGKKAALELTCQPTDRTINYGAGCKWSRKYYDYKGQLHNTPQPGDQIFFWPKDKIGGPEVAHTGLVYAVDDAYVYTIEGNTSGANGVVANGGGVCKKKYRLNYNRIAGYGRPNYGMTVTEPEKPTSASGKKRIVVTGNSVNIRLGDSTDYDRVAYLNKGDTMEWVATAENGWHAGRYEKQIVWVSGKYSTVETT